MTGLVYLFMASSTALRIRSFLLTNYFLAWLALRLNIVSDAAAETGGGFFSVADDLNLSTHVANHVVSQFGSGDVPSLQGSSLQQIIEIASSSSPFSYELEMVFLIGHCAFTWCVGLMAGYTAAYLYRRSHRAELAAGDKASSPAAG